MKYLPTFGAVPSRTWFDIPHTIEDLFNTFAVNDVGDRWSPRVDIAETEEAYLVKAELPAVSPEDIDITLDGRTLTIRGEKKRAEKREGESWTHVERSYGSFVRTFTLPSPVEDKAIEAKDVDGVLEVYIPKSRAGEPRKIDIKTN